mmetsp:Transcript_11856/g.21650  ORF Transcript_11856/g.21650 Transcript_11856/m.21650 type:complete len:128 (-) Transcript_11856:590-973(-)
MGDESVLHKVPSSVSLDILCDESKGCGCFLDVFASVVLDLAVHLAEVLATASSARLLLANDERADDRGDGLPMASEPHLELAFVLGGCTSDEPNRVEEALRRRCDGPVAAAELVRLSVDIFCSLRLE